MSHKKKIIYHIFNGASWLLVSQMIRSIIQYSSYRHYFVINLHNCDKNTYIHLFETLHYEDYSFLTSSKIDKIKSYIRLLLKGNYVLYNKVEPWLPLYGFLNNEKPNNLIVHSEMDYFSVILNDARVNMAWCCWGHIPSYNGKAFLIRLRSSYLFKQYVDNCRLIIALTEEDRIQLQKVYTSAKVIVTSYSYIYDFDKLECVGSKGMNILIGNSAHYLDDYRSIVNKICHITGAKITFMCSYGVRSQEKYEQFKVEMKELMPYNELLFWEENVTIQEYNKRIGENTIYIAGMERQSGLGAVTTALGSGLKVYLNGVNYSYFKNKGLKVFHIKDLEGVTKDDLFNWPSEEMEQNIKYTRIKCGINDSILEWERIYEVI